MTGKPLTILGIETSCDETAAAVVRGHAPGPGEILSNIVFSQIEAHAPYGGVVPEIASRAHLEILDDIIQRALNEAKITVRELDGVAATAGPGLIGGGMGGVAPGKALVMRARELGMVMNVTADTVIRLIPPLTLNQSEADFIINTVSKIVQE